MRTSNEDNWVLVTGGSRGIGLATVKRLSDQGYRCVVIDRDPFPVSGMAEHVVADLSEEKRALEIFAHVARTRPITRLVNNVGTVLLNSVESASVNELSASVNLNVGTSLLALQALLPAMKEMNFGRVVNISSRSALGKPLRSTYAASKAAVHGLTRTWSLELARYGITVNAIAPGPIATELFEQTNPPDSPVTQKILQTIPVGRLGKPEEIAAAISFFLDEDSAFVTGQVLYVCGGMTVGLTS